MSNKEHGFGQPLFVFIIVGFTYFSRSQGLTPRMGGTPGPKGTLTPGRGSVRDKLSINREDALMEDYESAHMARQQQVSHPAGSRCFTCSFVWLLLTASVAIFR